MQNKRQFVFGKHADKIWKKIWLLPGLKETNANTVTESLVFTKELNSRCHLTHSCPSKVCPTCTCVSLWVVTLLAKLNIKSTFRYSNGALVWLSDHILLSMQWNNSVYVDTVLLLRLRLAPKHFDVITDVIQQITHYLNNFIVLSQDLGEDDTK